MKKIICIILIVLLSFSAALAESVTQRPYELVMEEGSRIGKYTGNMVNGKPEGYGIFVTTNPNGYSWHYIGNWKDGLMHGEGAVYWEDGSLEIGEYEYGRFIFGYYSYDGADLALYSSGTLGDRSVITMDISTQADSTEPEALEVQFIGNKKSHVFHKLNCESVSKMKDKNKVELYTRDDAINLGYKPCDRCNP